ncbi:MAG TPA: small, acid-soluble spore protein, alpha/beta type [Methylomusa anaerophila]|uniref:Small, acid-soluble spore proteins, alpha/beta type n=1 Tax=Methylomusa anaerophila TaxID=1930071 RepID=A0A348ALA8_9FIRM|nr:small, acid-soluble spore protein, alpha/beta type [Methylomusa anaerophila]BBB91856.1 small, acid-soluble spore proteins, alpha/beta type [Methylomusa anaerophila]HML88412.1 small, acid-soluble spore protein, alpha/beta type [Methylomusa anaerophila]
MTQKYRSMEELDASLPDKHEVAAELGIPLDKGHNENLTTREAGKIGGKIGGEKIKKIIEMAEAQMAERK